jgi:hypothetical protein
MQLAVFLFIEIIVMSISTFFRVIHTLYISHRAKIQFLTKTLDKTFFILILIFSTIPLNNIGAYRYPLYTTVLGAK